MSFTAGQASALLENSHTEEELRLLIGQLDTNTHGSVTVLYSGSLNGSDQHSMDAIAQLKANPELRILDNTEAFKLSGTKVSELKAS